MRWFRKKQAAGTGNLDRAAVRSDLDDLEEFAKSRVGVEGFVEPRTTVTSATIVLVARDGEWIRRRVPDENAGHALARRLGIPSYEAARVGYPQRMKEWSRQQAGRGLE